jgi:hypothetical protein
MSQRNTETETMGEERTLAKVVRKIPLNYRPTDFAYWQLQPYQARLAALEAIRQEYHRGRDDPAPGLQRLCKIVKR